MKDVVCLSGSMRGFPEMLELASELTSQGKIVLAPFSLKNGDPGLDAMLDTLHKRKIDMSERLYVVTIAGYIGESTRSEITYASERGIPITYRTYERAPAVAAYEQARPAIAAYLTDHPFVASDDHTLVECPSCHRMIGQAGMITLPDHIVCDFCFTLPRLLAQFEESEHDETGDQESERK